MNEVQEQDCLGDSGMKAKELSWYIFICIISQDHFFQSLSILRRAPCSDCIILKCMDVSWSS